MDSNNSNITNGADPPASGSGTPSSESLTVKICLIVLAVVAIFGNGMVVYFIWTKHRLRTKTNVMVASLAFSDLVVAVTIIPSFLACMYVECDDQLSKLFYDAFLFVSVCNLCCITFDRFLAVTRPLRYHMKMTKRTVLVFVILSWLVPTIVSIIPVTWLYTDTGQDAVSMNNKIFYTIQVVVFMFCPCLIMLVAYAVIFNIAWKHTRHIRHVLKSLNTTNGPTSRPLPPMSVREAKATLKVFGTVVTMFVFCWCLSGFRTIVLNYKLMVLSPDLVIASRIILVGNSAINPIIYAFLKKDIKTEIQRLLKLNARTGVRPSSSGIFRSNQNSRYEANSTGFERKLSRVGSTQSVAMSDVKASDETSENGPVKTLEKPLNGIINEVMAESDEDDSRSETKDDETSKPSSVDLGKVNMVAEVDGCV